MRKVKVSERTPSRREKHTEIQEGGQTRVRRVRKSKADTHVIIKDPRYSREEAWGLHLSGLGRIREL